MNKISIYLKAIEANNQIELVLTDSEGHHGVGTITTEAKKNDQVEWKLAPHSDINKIVDIKAKETSPNVFVKDPHRIHDDLWKGIISSKATGSEEYNIWFEYKDKSVIFVDPKIIIVPH